MSGSDQDHRVHLEVHLNEDHTAVHRELQGFRSFDVPSGALRSGQRPKGHADQWARLPSRPIDWRGLMGYNDGGIRVIGEHPQHERLLYKLGCNGVGFLPSIYGGHHIARFLTDERLSPSIFDPR